VVLFFPMTNKLKQTNVNIFLMCRILLCCSDKRLRSAIKLTNSVKQVSSLVQIWLPFPAIKPSASHLNIPTCKKSHNYPHPFHWLAIDVSA
jgi:hypothetical protein